jgi:putative methionine-R-sulfoxide reductase with GAF domain
MIAPMDRPYAAIAARLTPEGTLQERMKRVVDALWDALHPTGVSWVGFYVPEGPDAMTLAARRDKPACSPIALHGVCGQAFRQKRAIVVRDVAQLGENYIACDLNDRSEIVLPCFDERGLCWGVLDLDSHDLESFGNEDVDGLTTVLKAAGLTQ